MKTAKIVGCGFAGFWVFAFGSVYIASNYIWPGSNMAGVVCFVAAPIGLVAGLFVGWLWASKNG